MGCGAGTTVALLRTTEADGVDTRTERVCGAGVGVDADGGGIERDAERDGAGVEGVAALAAAEARNGWTAEAGRPGMTDRAADDELLFDTTAGLTATVVQDPPPRLAACVHMSGGVSTVTQPIVICERTLAADPAYPRKAAPAVAPPAALADAAALALAAFFLLSSSSC